MKRLLTNGRFSENETEEKLRENILKLSNPTKAFLEINIEKTNNAKDFIIETELYSEFLAYCDLNNLPSVRKSQFTQALTEYFPEVKQTKQRILGKAVKVYQFIKKTVPTVPSDISDAEKQTEFLKINNPVGTLGTEKRLCSDECSNFDKPSCTAPNWADLNKKSEIPLKCPGYSYVGTFEEPS